MITDLAQRWDNGRPVFEVERDPAKRFNPLDHEVETIYSDNVAKAFVLQHHYERSYPSARFRFGLRTKQGELVGVAVFSTPMHNAVLTKVFPCAVEEATDLGRFVLLQGVKKYAETWFLARCRELLRKAGILGHVAFSDPEPRTTESGDIVMPGHVGGIYQASNAVFLGRTKASRKLLLPDGTTMSPRALSKVRNGERGHGHVIEKLQRVTGILCGRDVHAWLVAVERRLRPVKHPGTLKYAFPLDRRIAKHLPASLPYLKIRRAA